MKKYLIFLTLVIPMVAVAENNTVNFPALNKSYLKQFPKIEVQKAINLSAINNQPNMTKRTVRLLAGNPHFNEFMTNNWNYAFNIRKPATQEYVLCQAQIHFKRNIATSIHWNKPICQYLSQKAVDDERKKTVKTAQTKPKVVEVEVPAPSPTSYTLNSDLLFDFDSSRLNIKGSAELDKVISTIIEQYIQIDSIKIVGHSDRIGSTKYNMTLSKKRADAVADYLSVMGLKADAVIGLGESQPITSGCHYTNKVKLKQCLYKDRRVQIIVNGITK